MPELEPLTGSAEGKGLVAGAVVGHHALDPDVEALVIAECILETGDRAALLLAGHDLGEGDTRVIVDADVDILPTHPAAVALSSTVACDAVADPIELAQFFDVDVDELARLVALIALRRLGRFERAEPIETQPEES